jgi:Ca-activated chloride channel homolog
VLIPVLAICMGMWRRRRVQLSDSIVSKTLFEKISVRKYDHYGRRRNMVLFSFLLIILALVNPQLPGEKQKVSKESADIFIAFDISRSMLAQDIAPDRLTRSKLFAVSLVKSLRTERIGLIVFAGAAYVYMPLTSDYNAAIDFINGLSTEMASYQGTAIGDAVLVAEKAFTEEANRNRGLIIISDGEDHDSGALKSAEAASKNGLVITTLGVGTERGGMIPDMNQGGSNYKLDENGSPVRSKLDASILKEIAQKARGTYYNINDSDNAIKGVKEMVDKLDKGAYQTIDTSNNFSCYPFFLWPALLLLLFEYLMSVGLFIKKSGQP